MDQLLQAWPEFIVALIGGGVVAFVAQYAKNKADLETRGQLTEIEETVKKGFSENLEKVKAEIGISRDQNYSYWELERQTIIEFFTSINPILNKMYLLPLIDAASNTHNHLDQMKAETDHNTIFLANLSKLELIIRNQEIIKLGKAYVQKGTEICNFNKNVFLHLQSQITLKHLKIPGPENFNSVSYVTKKSTERHSFIDKCKNAELQFIEATKKYLITNSPS